MNKHKSRTAFSTFLIFSLFLVGCSKEDDSSGISLDGLKDKFELNQGEEDEEESFGTPLSGIELETEGRVLQKKKPGKRRLGPSVPNESAVDGLQVVEKTETVETLHDFLKKIKSLDEEAKKRLLKTKLMNVRLVHETVGNDAPFGRLSVDDDSWRVVNDKNHKSRNNFDDDGYVETSVTISITANADIKEWVKAKVEYNRYSKETVRDSDIQFDISGKVKSFEFKGYNNSHGLVLVLEPYKTGQAFLKKGAVFKGTMRENSRFLQKRTSLWVKYYLNNHGEKPKKLGELKNKRSQ